MNVKGLITGIENVKGEKSGRSYDFHKLNFIDTESASGSPQSVTLPKDGHELAKVLPILSAAKLKVMHFSIFQNGNYMNFGAILAN